MSCIDTKFLLSLKEVLEDDLAVVLSEFLVTMPQTLENIDKAILSKDASALRLHAHTLKGASANLGAKYLPDLCGVLEKKGLKATWNDIETDVQKVRSETKSVIDFLENYIHSI